MVPINDLIKHKYEQKNQNRQCKKITAKLKEEEDDDEAMMQSMMKVADRSSSPSVSRACSVRSQSAVKVGALPLQAYSKTTSHCAATDIEVRVPAVKVVALPLQAYSEEML